LIVVINKSADQQYFVDLQNSFVDASNFKDVFDPISLANCSK